MDLVNRMMGAFDEVKDALPRPVFGFRRLGQDDKIERLQTVPLLEECTGRQLREIARITEVQELPAGAVLREIARITEVQELPAGAVLTRVGEPGEEFFLIVDGSARVDVPGGKSVPLKPGDFFGEMSLLDGGPRSATVTAETAIRVLVIKRRHFATLLREAPALTLKLCATLARRVRDLEQRT